MADAPPADTAPPGDPRIARVRLLLERLDAPDVAADLPLQKALIDEATALVDRAARPTLWAYLRHLSGLRCELDEPEKAVAAYEEALTAFGPDDADRTVWTLCEGGIGTVLARTEPPGTPGGERAVAHLERVVEAAPQWYAELLATLYGWRTAGDPLANWERQVALLDLAAAHAAPDSAAAHRIALARNAALSSRPGDAFGDAVERTLEAHRRTLATQPPGSRRHAETAVELATAWLDRSAGDLAANAREAEGLLHQALGDAVALGDRTLEARSALLLGRVRTFRRESLGDAGAPGDDAPHWIARGRAAAEAAGERMLVASASKSLALASLARLRAGDAAALEPAVDAARAAATAFGTVPAYADEVRKLLQIEADAWLAAGRPADAIAPLAAAVDRVHAALAAGTSRDGRLELAWRVRDSAALLAWCHAESGDAHGACAALERGRGLLWGPSAHWTGDWLRIVPPGGAVVVPIFAGPTGAAVLATASGGVVSLETVGLPEAGAEAMRALVSGAEPAERLGGWLAARALAADDPAVLDGAIATVAAELHRRVVAPVVARLDALGIAVGAEVVWLPQGASSILPLQAAAPVAGGPGLVDRVALRFAPSLAALEGSAREEPGGPAGTDGSAGSAASAGARRAGRPLALVDPTGDLPFAPLEARWLAEAVPGLEVLAGAAATVEALEGRLAARPALLHVAAHGAFDAADPFRSALRLAGGEPLTLDRLLPRLEADGAPALAVLSACETSVARVTAWADEQLGFPAALLAHGVGGVVGSLWTVPDAQTAFLMRAFHAARATQSASVALRSAQRWLRDATRDELMAILEPLRDAPAPIGPVALATLGALAEMDAEAPPFAHPFHWAGFALWGQAPAASAPAPAPR